MPQYTHQFLSGVLSQRGPSALPYAEDMKWHIRKHLVNLSEAFPSMQPKVGVYTHNDGRNVNLLKAEGTVPTTYQGVTYNIPVVIWLMEGYPSHGPLVFVNPTRDMIIKRPHPFVSLSGVVSIPYIDSWCFPTHNLAGLVSNLSLFFARNPPLYSQRKPSNPNLGQSYSRSNSSAGRPAIHPREKNSYGGGRVTEDTAEVSKKNTVNKLVENLSGDIKELRKDSEGKMEDLLGAQVLLRKREEKLRKELKEMQREKDALEQQLQMVLMNSDILGEWLRDSERKLGNINVSNLDGDEVFEPCDALSKQMLDCTALDLAVEDTIYALDKAVQEGAIPADLYLRNVRLMSREQFFHRATASKVRAVQLQAQVSGMASRASSEYAF